ncbi:MAG: hypothetical protein J4G10_05695 [Alphaproteobacteria bacterium]|nr:hypothetical protein [Alphaproteobacteria bacterium]
MRVGKTGTDWGAKFENLHFRNCFGNAIDFGSGTIVNIHMNRIRFDAIGGFCIRFSADASHESRPVSIYQFTYDNSPTPEFFGFAAQMQGYYDKRHWGKGFLLLEDTKGVTFNVNDGRIELNSPLALHDTRKAMIYVNQTIGGGSTTVRLENVHGFLQPSDGGVGVFAKAGRTNFSAASSKIRNASALFEDYKQKKVISRMAQEVTYQANPQQSQGFHLQASQIELRASPPDGTVYNFYRQGDIVFREKVRSGGHLGWICTDSDGHLRIPAAPVYKDAVAVTAGNPVVTVLDPERRRDFVTGLAVTLVGAGADGADLDTFITETGGEAATFTVNDAPATGRVAGEVRVQAPRFEPFGIAGGVQADGLANSQATDVPGLVRDFNALLTRLRKAKLIKG